MAEEIQEEKITVPAKFKKLVEEIETMNVLDLSELVKILEKKFGVSAAMPVAVGAVPAGVNGKAEEVEEKTEFNVVLTSYGDKKIDVIKAVKDVSGKGLKEAKDLVDAVDKGAQVVKEKAKKDKANEMKKKIETAGGKVELK